MVTESFCTLVWGWIFRVVINSFIRPVTGEGKQQITKRKYLVASKNFQGFNTNGNFDSIYHTIDAQEAYIPQFAGTHLYTWVKRSAKNTVLPQNTMQCPGQGSTWTARSEMQCINTKGHCAISKKTNCLLITQNFFPKTSFSSSHKRSSLEDVYLLVMQSIHPKECVTRMTRQTNAGAGRYLSLDRVENGTKTASVDLHLTDRYKQYVSAFTWDPV